MRAVPATVALAMLLFASSLYSWQGEVWDTISRAAILSRASEMTDSTWSPRNTIINYPGARTYYAGRTYKGELYSVSTHQDWTEFQNAVTNTPGGTTYYGNYCTGLVNISWRLPKFYSIPAIIGNLGGSYFYALGEFGDAPFLALQPGDALYTDGHIFLFSGYNADGTINTMEQLAPTARRRTWSWNALSTFRPIRRNLVAGAVAINDRVETSYSLLVRSGATFTASSLWTAPIAAQGTVVAGPVNNERYRWWKVKFDRYAVAGWVTEGYLTKLSAQDVPCAGQDASRPNGSVKINSGASYANTRAVILTLSCTDSGSGCASMRFSDDNIGWSEWEPFAATKKWVLGSGEGAKSVYVQFQDACGNSSPSVSDTANFQTLTPDLIVSSFGAPAAASAGATILLSDITGNTGAGGANASMTTFFFSSDNSLDSGDVRLGARSIPALSAGSNNGGGTWLTVPPTVSPGVFYLIAKANSVKATDDCQYIKPCGSLIEASRSNNFKVSKITVGPDLTVSVLTVSVAGGAMNIGDSVRNSGSDAAGSSAIRFYLSTDSILEARDALLGARYVSTIAPGASNSGTTSVAIPAGLGPGNYHVISKADSGSDVVEANENNNGRSRSFTY